MSMDDHHQSETGHRLPFSDTQCAWDQKKGVLVTGVHVRTGIEIVVFPGTIFLFNF